MTTNIQVSDEVWSKLNKLKSFPGESFDDILKKLLKKYEEAMEVKK